MKYISCCISSVDTFLKTCTAFWGRGLEVEVLRFIISNSSKHSIQWTKENHEWHTLVFCFQRFSFFMSGQRDSMYILLAKRKSTFWIFSESYYHILCTNIVTFKKNEDNVLTFWGIVLTLRTEAVLNYTDSFLGDRLAYFRLREI